MVGGNFWTEKEVKILKKNYSTKSIEELMKLLPKRTYYAILHKAERLGHHKEGGSWKVHLKPPKVKQLPEFWKGYITGIIDGEGMICLTKGRSGVHPRISVSNTNLDVIKKVKKVVGAGGICLRQRTKSWKEVWQWKTASVTDVKALLTQLRDCFIIKKQQALLVLKFCELYMNRPCYSSKPTLKMLEIYKQVKELNKRGFR